MPVAGFCKVLVEQGGDGMATADGRDVADRAFIDQRFHLLIDGIAAHLVTYAELDTGSFDGVYDGIAVFQRKRHRLLQQNMLAGFGGGNDVLGVSVGRAGDENGVDVLTRQHLIEIGHPIEAELGGMRLTALRIVIPGRDNASVVVIGDDAAIAQNVTVRETDYAEANRSWCICHNSYPSLTKSLTFTSTMRSSPSTTIG